MRHSLILALLATPVLAAPAFADSEASWEKFRIDVADACTALVTDPGEVTVEVSPFGSETYGAALVTLTAEYGTDRMICIYDKATKVAELTAPFTPVE